MKNPSGWIRILTMNIERELKPRKKPSQARSEVTIKAIHEASIQVLLQHGLAKFTTTRAAERAGVSVGTLYQYFPNKEALLYSLLLKHFDMLATSFETVSRTPNLSLETLSSKLSNAYVEVKLADPKQTKALYLVAGAINQARLTKDISLSLETAVVEAIESVTDASFEDSHSVSFTLLSALAGLSRSSFGKLPDDEAPIKRLPEQARLLVQSYLFASANNK